MSMKMEEDLKRWTAKRKSAVMQDIICTEVVLT
ncbi:Uncharacterised protein [Achromobacter sp. 2789STDY5608633]|uniref:Transposase n=1 Tax=Achromobacter insuavis TaxID=1287735 RepID=A0A6J5AUC9_9BURK|nr:hypothetical protein LMG26845_04169 [Achromobacter insuavis]CUJ15074.1 Uncharacterised protein [Achromobacter sp. 2789STDY5608633]CUJ57474.1 Uncharacterised protein [Achromobacter sp. 2789STDY5608628]